MRDEFFSEPHAASNGGRIAGIDYGTVRIGIAMADPDMAIATPYETYHRVGPDADEKYFCKLVSEEQITRFVVGLPVHLDGHESQKSAEARQFGQWLADITGVSVDFFDERFSSTEAEQHLLDAQLTFKRRKNRLDKIAAQIILTAYLESRSGGQDTPGPIDD